MALRLFRFLSKALIDSFNENKYSANTWSRHGWISGNEVNTVRAAGYYTTLIRPGFRLIALNNNDCYIYNWWVMYSRTEIQATMQWLHDTLLAAERANERVHIIKHIPSGLNYSIY
jgi:sphingomyelin phosphodiesterase